MQIINPAVSPIYDNNPGYGWLELNSDNSIKSLLFPFLQLEDYHRLGLTQFQTFDLMRNTGMDLNSVDSVRDYWLLQLTNQQVFADFNA